MGNLELARWYAALLGVMLIVLGLAGFVDNPIVGEPAGEPLFVSGAANNLLHIFGGSLAVFIAFGLPGRGLVRGLLALGAALLLLLVATLASPTLFGLFDNPVNLAGQVLYAGLATLSLVIGWLARGRPALQAAAV